LEGSGWVKAFTMRSSRRVIIERRLCYRVTDQGLAAKKKRV